MYYQFVSNDDILYIVVGRSKLYSLVKRLG